MPFPHHVLFGDTLATPLSLVLFEWPVTIDITIDVNRDVTKWTSLYMITDIVYHLVNAIQMTQIDQVPISCFVDVLSCNRRRLLTLSFI